MVYIKYYENIIYYYYLMELLFYYRIRLFYNNESKFLLGIFNVLGIGFYILIIVIFFVIFLIILEVDNSYICRVYWGEINFSNIEVLF